MFRDDPRQVADTFATLLESPRWRTAFDRVVFAIYDRTPRRPTLGAFCARFGGVLRQT